MQELSSSHGCAVVPHDGVGLWVWIFYLLGPIFLKFADLVSAFYSFLSTPHFSFTRLLFPKGVLLS